MKKILSGVGNLWGDEWRNQTWLRELWVKELKHPPSLYEQLEISYWEPIYHPVNVFMEIERTLKRMRILFHRAHDEFAVRCFEIESKIGW